MIVIACFQMNPQSKSLAFHVTSDSACLAPAAAMCVVIGVGPVNLGDQVSVALGGNPAICKELPDGCGNRCGSVGGAVVLPDYHALPLIEEVIAPHDVVDPVLGQRQHEIHDREREQDVRVNEYPGHEQ
jgi:hypothetical protein